MDQNRAVGATFGTPGTTLWATQLGGVGIENGRAIAMDPDGNLVIAGEFEAKLTPAVGIELQSSGSHDIYVMKLARSSGAVMWAKRFGGTIQDFADAISVDGLGNIYVLGRFTGTVDFGSGPMQQSSAAWDPYVLKLTPGGDFQWVRRIGGTGLATPVGIAVNESSVVVVGSYNGSIAIDATTLSSSGSFDVFVLKISSLTGATSWFRSYGGAQRETADDIAVDSNGNIAIAGSFLVSASLGGGALTSAGMFDGYLLKLSPDGVHLFSKRFGGSHDDEGSGITFDPDGNIVMVGSFATTADFGCVSSLMASEASVQPDYRDIFLAKYTQAGACIWAKGFGGTGALDGISRYAHAVAMNSAGDIGLAGEFYGSMSFGGRTLTSASGSGKGDIFAARFSGDGIHLNSVRAGGAVDDGGRGVAQDADGSLFVIGNFEGLAEFGGNVLTSAGGIDAFVVGLAPL